MMNCSNRIASFDLKSIKIIKQDRVKQCLQKKLLLAKIDRMKGTESHMTRIYS